MILGLTGFVNFPNVSSFTSTEYKAFIFVQITVNKINEMMLVWNHMPSPQADSIVFNTRLPEQNNMTCRMHYSLLQMTEKHASDNLFQLDCV